MEEIRDQVEQSQPEASEYNQEETLSQQPVADVEDRLKKEAIDLVRMAIINQNGNYDDMDPEMKDQLITQAFEQLKERRNNLLSVFDRAEKEIMGATCLSFQPAAMDNAVRGIKNRFFLRFGNFGMTVEQAWIYQPTQQQMMKHILRYSSPKLAIRTAQAFHRQYAPIPDTDQEPVDGQHPLKENPLLIEFKQVLLKQIQEQRESV